MSLLVESQTTAELGDRLHNAYAVTAEFLSDIISQTSRRFLSASQSGKSARIERLIQAGARVFRGYPGQTLRGGAC